MQNKDKPQEFTQSQANPETDIFDDIFSGLNTYYKKGYQEGMQYAQDEGKFSAVRQQYEGVGK